MKYSKIIIVFLIFISAFGASALVYCNVNSSPDAIVGYWFTEDNKAKIQIYKSGDKYFGKIAWIKNPNHENGQPKLDKNNPDKNLRNKPIVGLVLLRNFKYAGKNTWEDGKIYDPESGNDYSSYLTLISQDKLEVRGYIGISLIGRSQVWTRAK